MPRIARVVIGGLPHHVTRRGNRRGEVLFCDEDRRKYPAWAADYASRYGVAVRAYCLMSNHVHFIAVPASHCGLREDDVLSPVAMPWPVADWSAYLREEHEEDVARLRQQTRTGRPCGGDPFVRDLERTLGRPLLRQKPGPKPKLPGKIRSDRVRKD